MRKTPVAIALALAAALLLSMGALQTQAEEPPLTGQMTKFRWLEEPATPPVSVFQGPDGQAMTLADLKGKVLLVNFWATWCAPCVAEMPELNRLQKEAGSDRFQVLAISQDREGAAVARPFLEKHGLDALALYTDPSLGLGRALKLQGLPTTLILDAQGRELGRLVGMADWAGKDARALIDWVLAQQPGGLPKQDRADAGKTGQPG